MEKKSFLERSDTEFIKAIEDEACFNSLLEKLSPYRSMCRIGFIGCTLVLVVVFLFFAISSFDPKRISPNPHFLFIVLFCLVTTHGGYIHADMKIKMLKSLRKDNSSEGV